jgi:membrane protein YqaA with SNARE-associated domain
MEKENHKNNKYNNSTKEQNQTESNEDKLNQEEIDHIKSEISELKFLRKNEVLNIKEKIPKISKNQAKKEIKKVKEKFNKKIRKLRERINRAQEKQPTEHKHLNVKQLLIRTVIFLGAALIIYVVVLLLAGRYLNTAGEWFSEYFGLWGIFAYVYLVDTFIVPATADVVFTITQQWEPVSLLAVMSIASIIGGFTGFLIGNKLNKLKVVRDTTESYRDIGSRMIKKYGVWAIVLAGLTPLPYSTISWIAGMLKLSPYQYLLGSISRIPRLVLYYLLIKAGVSLFS